MNALESRISLAVNGGYNMVGRAAMMLALSYTGEGDAILKTEFNENNFTCATTRLGSTTTMIKRKVIQAVLGTALSRGVIKKNAEELHALIQAAKEAQKGLYLNPMVNTGYALKIGLVTDNRWIAVAIFGQSAFHPRTNHERVGLGIMRIKQW